MECEGLVTKVDPYYGFFELDNKFKIHLSVLKGQVNTTKLPILNSTVKAKNLHKFSSIFVACRTTTLEGQFNKDFPSSVFTDLIKKYELGANDFLMIEKALKLLMKNFKFDSDELEKTIFSSLIEILIKTKRRKAEVRQVCLNGVIAHLDICSVSSCRYIEIQSNKYENFPKWSFGVHHCRQKENSILFGFLFVHPTYSYFMFKDAIHKMVCIITNGESIQSIDNSFVVFLDYKVITEVYENSKVPNLDYIIVDFKNIIIVHSLNNTNKNVLGEELPIEEFKIRTELILNRKSSVTIDSTNKTKTFLEVVLIGNENCSGDKIILTLPHYYTLINQFLKEGFKYNFFHNSPLVDTGNLLFLSKQKLKIFTLEDKGAYFQPLGSVHETSIPETIHLSKYKNQIFQYSDIFSMEAIIKRRGFAENWNLDSELFKKIPYGFSTLGSETHTISFSYEADDDSAVTMYLSKWINRLMPLGLIPEMRVIVKNVLMKRNKYIQPTIFTSFQVVNYEPQVPFQTANLFENFDYDWGPSYYLSKGSRIPCEVIVWSRLVNIRIVEMGMSSRCKNCEVLIETPGPCGLCSCQEKNVKFNMTLFTMDEFGHSKVYVKNPNFLRLVLDKQEKQFAVWWQVFENIGEYYFNLYNQDNRYGEYDPFVSESNYFKNLLTKLIETFNMTLIDSFEIKCRKLFQKKLEKYPKWLYIDGRNTRFC